MRRAISCVLVLAAAAVTQAADPAAPRYKLEGVKYIKHFVGSQQARYLLARQGLVVTDQQFKQVFSAYIGGGAPKFITVDSAWHTYHVLLEEGMRTMEERQATVLQRFSEKLYQAAKATGRQPDNVYADLAQFAGVGQALQDRSVLEKLDGEEEAVAEVVRRLDTGQDWTKVLFFGLPVSPQRLRASSFYTKNATLRGYFAARQWYAGCDFRLSSEPETERALHLVALIESDKELKSLYRKLTEAYDVLLGLPDDAGVRQYAAVAREVIDGGELTPEKIPASLAAFRREAAKLPDPKVNDQLLLPQEYVRFAERIKGFRLLPPRRLPSAVLFQNTVDPVVKGRMFPSGVDLFAAGPLACDAGGRALRASVKDTKSAESIENSKIDPLPDSLHGKALELFRLLQEPLPTNTPAPLRSSAWHDKQLWTALGAWAEQRHTWALHTKLTIHYLGLAHQPPGYVSPYPDFFRRLGRLARETSEALQAGGEYAPDPKAAAKELLACVDLIRRLASDDAERTVEDYNRSVRFAEFMEQYSDEGFPETDEAVARLCEDVEKLAGRWAAGENLQEKDRTLITMLMQPGGDVQGLLREFADLCDELAAIAGKQLAGKPLSKEDVDLIKGYGETLAKFHFYGGNAWLTPRDDFPLLTPVFASPVHSETLYAGIARPEALWVIINVQGRPVLHRGAVLSYREFRRPIARPLDDESWTAEVRAGKTPPPPAFTRSFRETISVEEVVRLIRDGKDYPAVGTMPDRAITRAMIDALVKRDSSKAANSYWLRRCLCERAGDEDVGDLLEVLQKTPVDNVGDIAVCIARRNWKPHRAAVMHLLRHETIQYADSAAFILSQRPEHVDLSTLASTYDRQKPRTRRLYCYVLGHLKRPDEAVTDLLLKMLGDKEASVRYQAALAAAQRGVREQRIDRQLIAGLDDSHTCTGATMARTLVELKVKESAPHMLARLKKLAAAGHTEPEPAGREEDFTRGSKYSGLNAIMVLSGERRNRPSLAEELTAGLGAFRYTAAQEQLRAMLSGRHGTEALRALIEIDPSRKVDLALQAALDTEVEWDARRYALGVLASTGSPDCVEPLLPMLGDRPREDGPQGSWIRGEVAETVGKLLAKGGSAGPSHKEIRQAAIARLRKLLQGESGTEAMNALIEIDPASRAKLLLQMALDKKAPGDVRSAALERIADYNPFGDDGGTPVDPDKIVVLLPLLDDTSRAHSWGEEKICECAAETVAEVVHQGVNDETKRTVTEHFRKMLHGEYGPAALDALVSIDRQRKADLLIEVAFDKRLRGNTRAHAIERIRWVDDRKIAGRLVPLLDDKSTGKKGLRICDLAADTIISVATAISVSDPEAEDPALKRLRAKSAHVEGETHLETLARKIEAARQWATAVGDK